MSSSMQQDSSDELSIPTWVDRFASISILSDDDFTDLLAAAKEEHVRRLRAECPAWCTDHAGGALKDDEDAFHQSDQVDIGGRRWLVVQGADDAGPRLFAFGQHETFPSRPMTVQETAELLALLPAREAQ